MQRNKTLSSKQLFITLFLTAGFFLLLLLLFGYKQDEQEFQRITSHLFQNEMEANTLNMHYTLAHPENFGIYGYTASLPCYASENALVSRASTENLLAALGKINAEKLPKDQQYTYKLLCRSLENAQALGQSPYLEEPLSPGSGMQSQLPILLAEYSFRDVGDIEDYLKLLDQTDEYFASLLTFEQEKAAQGLLMSEDSLKNVIKQCDTIVTLEQLTTENHFLQTTFDERLEPLWKAGLLTEAQKNHYLAENNRLLKEVMVPAYQNLGDGLFLLQDNCTALSGLSTKPNGAAYYEQLLIAQTGSYRDINQIKELLITKLEEEQKAIRSILSAHPELLDYMGNAEYTDFPLSTAEEILQHLQVKIAEDFPDISKIENNATTVTATVKTVSESLQDYCAPAFYLTPPIDDTDTNVIYINQKNTLGGLDLYTTLAHEGYPGHLYQTVYSNHYMNAHEENTTRQLLWYGGYLEGWALYVEFISFDYASEACNNAGMTEEALLAQLEKHNRSMQLCLYSLLDIMIHYEGASMTQISEVLADMGIENPASVKAIYTYIVEEPCNYLKYYLGYLEILELQKEAETLWGTAYSNYAFHCFYLESGASDFLSLRERLQENSTQIAAHAALYPTDSPAYSSSILSK